MTATRQALWALLLGEECIWLLKTNVYISTWSSVEEVTRVEKNLYIWIGFHCEYFLDTNTSLSHIHTFILTYTYKFVTTLHKWRWVIQSSVEIHCCVDPKSGFFDDSNVAGSSRSHIWASFSVAQSSWMLPSPAYAEDKVESVLYQQTLSCRSQRDQMGTT